MVDIADDNELMPVDPEMERIWNQDNDPLLSEVRAQEEAATPPDETTPPIEEDKPEDELEQPENKEIDSEDSKKSTETNPEKTPDEKQEEGDKPKQETVEVHKVKANGMELELSVDELKALAPKALDYTKKMQEIAPWRKTISALKEQGLGEQDVNLMIDALKGDKQAIAAVLKRTGVDALDLDTDSKEVYQPKQYGKEEHVQRIEEIVESISHDPEYSVTERVISSDWDTTSRQALAQNPDLIQGLHADVKNGIYEKVAPMAMKLKALDGGKHSDLQYYIAAGEEFYKSQAASQTQATATPPPADVKREQQQTEIKEMADKRRAAAPSRAGGKRDVIDYLDDNDENYTEWYNSLMAKS